MKIYGVVTGADKVMKKFQDITLQNHDEIKKAVYRACVGIQKRAQKILTELGHIVTGNLRRNIKSEADFVTKYEVVGIIGTDVPYGPYIEALPDGGYLYKAYLEEAENAVNYINNELKRILK